MGRSTTESDDERLLKEEITSPALQSLAMRLMRTIEKFEKKEISREEALTVTMMCKGVAQTYALDLERMKIRRELGRLPRKLLE